jgi:hypothetical protein
MNSRLIRFIQLILKLFNNVIDQYTMSQDAPLQTLIKQFVDSEAKIQRITNPSD